MSRMSRLLAHPDVAGGLLVGARPPSSAGVNLPSTDDAGVAPTKDEPLLHTRAERPRLQITSPIAVSKFCVVWASRPRENLLVLFCVGETPTPRRRCGLPACGVGHDNAGRDCGGFLHNCRKFLHHCRKAVQCCGKVVQHCKVASFMSWGSCPHNKACLDCSLPLAPTH